MEVAPCMLMTLRSSSSVGASELTARIGPLYSGERVMRLIFAIQRVLSRAGVRTSGRVDTA